MDNDIIKDIQETETFGGKKTEEEMERELIESQNMLPEDEEENPIEKMTGKDKAAMTWALLEIMIPAALGVFAVLALLIWLLLKFWLHVY